MNTDLLFNEVLIIDDNAIDLIINSRVVQLLNIAHEIATKNSGEEALSYLLEKNKNGNAPPDLILLDIMMPNMNGLEFLTEFAKLPGTFIQTIRIVMVSSSLEKEDYNATMRNKNVVDFLNKPLTLEKLESVFSEKQYPSEKK